MFGIIVDLRAGATVLLVYRLAEAYLAALPAAAEKSDLEIALLDATLAALHARGAAAHGDVGVDDAAFSRHLARCGAAMTAGPDGVRAEDVFLVCAAIAGNPIAVDRLRQLHEPVIRGYLRPISGVTHVLEDITQRVWEALLVADGDAPPKLASYSGRGELEGFIGVSAQRLALSTVRRSGAEDRAIAGAAVEAIAVTGDPELGIIKEHYREVFQQAVHDSLRLLPDRERTILRMQVADRLTVDQIAKVYGIGQATASRWLAQARDAILAGARRLLRERLQVSAQDFDSLAGLLLSQLDLSVSRAFAAAG